jgi:hypothetical protein
MLSKAEGREPDVRRMDQGRWVRFACVCVFLLQDTTSSRSMLSCQCATMFSECQVLVELCVVPCAGHSARCGCSMLDDRPRSLLVLE